MAQENGQRGIAESYSPSSPYRATGTLGQPFEVQINNPPKPTHKNGPSPKDLGLKWARAPRQPTSLQLDMPNLPPKRVDIKREARLSTVAHPRALKCLHTNPTVPLQKSTYADDDEE